MAGNENSGRKLTLNDEMIKKICSFIQGGNTFYRSCILSSISENVFYSWKKQGIEDEEKQIDSIYLKFLKAVKQAEEYFKAYHLKKITDSCEGEHPNVESSKWLLERRCPEEYGRKDRLSIDGGLNVMKYDIELTGEEKKEYDDRLASMFLKNTKEE